MLPVTELRNEITRQQRTPHGRRPSYVTLWYRDEVWRSGWWVEDETPHFMHEQYIINGVGSDCS